MSRKHISQNEAYRLRRELRLIRESMEKTHKSMRPGAYIGEFHLEDGGYKAGRLDMASTLGRRFLVARRYGNKIELYACEEIR